MNYVTFDKLYKTNGTSATASALKLGLSKGNTTSWRKGGNPSADILIKPAIVNDQGYIKQRGEDKLISLNPKAPDVEIHEGDVVYCRGRVLGKAEPIE